MKLLRISASALALSGLALLAACGGGGGGGSTPNPGGGGGGGVPPTVAPTSGPTQSPTQSPTQAPTQSPTQSPTQAPTSAPIGTSSQVIIAGDTGRGPVVNGTDNWQNNGVTDPDKGDGDTSTGGTGPNAVGPISCAIGTEAQVSSTVYHVHAFLGVLVNGQEMAIPDAIGMQSPDSNDPILSFTCAYNLHTHAASGVIHVEDPAIAGNWNTKPTPVSPPAKYNLQALMDVWGQSLTGLAGGPGLPTIYMGTPTATTASGADLVNTYSLYTGSATNLLLQHHVAIWLVYGTPPAAGLPQIEFGITN